MLRAIEILVARVAPIVCKELAASLARDSYKSSSLLTRLLTRQVLPSKLPTVKGLKSETQ